ncbi:MAG TPA: pitrilysin family protein [Saprospiraceae bacterium]|mgnify:CR=1 FL=1|nr:pitrilysin family protein [Saprospiraceae bacterium]
MINRKKGPEIHPVQKLNIPSIDQYTLTNGIKVCEVNLGSQEIVKIEIVHTAGRSYEDHHLIGRATSSLLKDGCGSLNSAEIAEKIDYYGSSIKTASNMDFSFTSIHTLNKHCDRILPLLHAMYTTPTFPEDEIEKFKSLNIQKLKEELTKNEVITYRQITEEIFGIDHPYGYNSKEEDYLGIDRQKIIHHFDDFYGSDNCYLFLSGHITDSIRKDIDAYFGQTIKSSKKKIYQPSTTDLARKEILISSKNEHQSAIKTGRKLFDKNHPDNAAVFVLNTLLGGYFGSRLMTNIREEKGLTYDIYSSVDQMLFDGCFYVSTEAATEYVTPILKEIYKEMDILKQEKADLEELQMVKNYLMGNFMNMLDGPMNVSSFAKSMVLTGKNPEEFHDFADAIIGIEPEKVMDVAQKYLNKEQMIEIVVSPI